MGRLSQKELVNRQLYEEGIATWVNMAKKAASGLVRGAVAGTKEVGAALMPHTAEALGKIGKLASSGIVKIAAENPKMALRNYLESARGRRRFNNINLGRETRQDNGDAEIAFSGEVYDEKEGKFTDVIKVPNDTAPDYETEEPVEGFFIVREHESSRDSDQKEWEVFEAVLNDSPNGVHSERTVIWSGQRRQGRGTDKPGVTPKTQPGPSGAPPNPRGGGSGPPPQGGQQPPPAPVPTSTPVGQGP